MCGLNAVADDFDKNINCIKQAFPSPHIIDLQKNAQGTYAPDLAYYNLRTSAKNTKVYSNRHQGGLAIGASNKYITKYSADKRDASQSADFSVDQYAFDSAGAMQSVTSCWNGTCRTVTPSLCNELKLVADAEKIDVCLSIQKNIQKTMDKYGAELSKANADMNQRNADDGLNFLGTQADHPPIDNTSLLRSASTLYICDKILNPANGCVFPAVQASSQSNTPVKNQKSPVNNAVK